MKNIKDNLLLYYILKKQECFHNSCFKWKQIFFELFTLNLLFTYFEMVIMYIYLTKMRIIFYKLKIILYYTHYYSLILIITIKAQ